MQRSLVIAQSRLAGLLTFKTDRLGEAVDAYGDAFAASTVLLSKDPRNTDIRRITAYNLLGAGQALAWLGRHDDALGKRREALDMMRELLATEPESETYGVGLGQALSEIGESLHATGRLAAAKRQLEESGSLLRGLPGARETRLNTTQFLIASNDLRLARVLADQARTSHGRSGSLAVWQEARAIFHSSAKVYSAASADRVLAGKELDERRAQADTGLRECDVRIASLHGSS
jgi:tetratricopeptide (TPR) repeat protein